MQFEGHSTTVADIVVDAVGKYAYAVGSPHAGELPVIMDVKLEERTKVWVTTLCMHKLSLSPQQPGDAKHAVTHQVSLRLCFKPPNGHVKSTA